MINRNKYKKGRGWHGDSHRHYLASKGISTTNAYFKRKIKPRIKEIEYNVEPTKEGMVYPITPAEVKKVLAREDPEHLKGLKAVEFANPKGIEKGAWAQYVNSRNVIKIFSQPFKDGKLDGQSPEKVNKHLKDYVIKHEVGHHRALKREKIKDDDMDMAEARADAHVIGMHPKDPSVRHLAGKQHLLVS